MSEEKEQIRKKIEGYENTIWAYKFEFTDLEETQRKEVIAEFEKKKRIAEAQLKAIDVIKMLKDLND
jgi:hypothetical protein